MTVALPEDGPSPAGVTDAMAHRGYVLVPGRLAVPRTVRLGCIGALTRRRTARAAEALAEVLAPTRRQRRDDPASRPGGHGVPMPLGQGPLG